MTGPLQVQVSAALQRTVDLLGPPAERWLATLPERIAEVATEWDLQLGEQLDHVGECSVILPATTPDDAPAILKFTVPHDDAVDEGTALRRWNGAGAARLLRSSQDGFTLLLERCHPGHDLWTLPIDEQVEVTAGLLPRLWVDPDGTSQVRSLSGTAAEWARRMRLQPEAFDAPPELVARCAGWAEQLADTAPARVLLHGDLNPGNVLAADREPWLVIDPKPWLGDPAFDLGQMLMNWVWAEDTSTDEAIVRAVARASRLADRLGLDVVRVLRWAAVKALAWDNGRDQIVALDAAAVSVAGRA